MRPNLQIPNIMAHVNLVQKYISQKKTYSDLIE